MSAQLAAYTSALAAIFRLYVLQSGLPALFLHDDNHAFTQQIQMFDDLITAVQWLHVPAGYEPAARTLQAMLESRRSELQSMVANDGQADTHYADFEEDRQAFFAQLGHLFHVLGIPDGEV